MWNKNDEVLEEKLGDLNNILDQLNVMAHDQGEQIEMRDKLVEINTMEAKKVGQILKEHNLQIVELLSKYRAPSKWCGDCCMCLLLVGLISVIVMLVKNGK